MAGPLGIDLLAAPGFAAHDAQGLDLVPVARLRRGARQETRDFSLVETRENLAQALLLRLLTPRGALGGLGHGDYGSRLHELIGRRKTNELRALAKTFVLETVAQERRVEPKLVDFRFEPDEERVDSFAFTLAVSPVSGGDPVELGLEVAL